MRNMSALFGIDFVQSKYWRAANSVESVLRYLVNIFFPQNSYSRKKVLEVTECFFYHHPQVYKVFKSQLVGKVMWSQWVRRDW